MKLFRVKYSVAIVCQRFASRLGLTTALPADSLYDISLDYSISEVGVPRDRHAAHLEWTAIPCELAERIRLSLVQNLEPLEGIDAEDLNEQDADHSTQVLAVSALRVYEVLALAAPDLERAIIENLEADATTEQPAALPEPATEPSVSPDPATATAETATEPQATTLPATEPSTEVSTEVTEPAK